MTTRIFLSRRNSNEGGCSMNRTSSGSGRVDSTKGLPNGEFRGQTKLVKITEDVRKYAAENAIDETTALEHGMRHKAAEFQHSGAEIYSKRR
jgi:hypothetical protein